MTATYRGSGELRVAFAAMEKSLLELQLPWYSEVAKRRYILKQARRGHQGGQGDAAGRE
jgi:hypothetical protein